MVLRINLAKVIAWVLALLLLVAIGMALGAFRVFVYMFLDAFWPYWLAIPMVLLGWLMLRKKRNIGPRSSPETITLTPNAEGVFGGPQKSKVLSTINAMLLTIPPVGLIAFIISYIVISAFAYL